MLGPVVGEMILEKVGKCERCASISARPFLVIALSRGGDKKGRSRHAQGDEQRDHVELPQNSLECEVPVVHIHEREIGDERGHGASAWWDGCLPCYNHQPRHNLNKRHIKLLAMPSMGNETYAAKPL